MTENCAAQIESDDTLVYFNFQFHLTESEQQHCDVTFVLIEKKLHVCDYCDVIQFSRTRRLCLHLSIE